MSSSLVSQRIQRLEESKIKYLEKSFVEIDLERKRYYLIKSQRKDKKLMKLLREVEPTPVSTPVSTPIRQYDRDIGCSICGKVGLDTGNLQEHIIRKHLVDTDAEVLKCALVRTISNRLRAQWLYRNDGSVACTVSGCEARMKTPRSRRIHIVNIHSDMDAEAFKALLERSVVATTSATTTATTTATTSAMTTATTSAMTSQMHSRIQSVFNSDSEAEDRSPTPSPVTPVRLRVPVDPVEKKAEILQENARIVNLHRDSFEEMQRVQWQLWQDALVVDAEIRVCRDPVAHEMLKSKKAAQATAAEANVRAIQDAYEVAEAIATRKIDALFEAYKRE